MTLHQATPTPTRIRVWTAGIFAVAAVSFFAWRMSFDLIWDDSPAVTAIQFDRNPANRNAALAFGQPGALTYYFRTAFSTLGHRGFRPMSSLLSNVGASFFRPDGPPRWIWMALVSLIVGGFAATYFRVALYFAGSIGWALFALIMLFASPPYLCAVAVVFAGIQTIVPLALCGSLLLYWSATAENASLRRRRVSCTALAVVLIVGPWFREFIGLASLLIAALELMKHRRLTRLVGLSSLTFLHAVFPTAVIKWTIFPDLPLLPVFQLGHLGQQAGSVGIHWEVFLVLLMLAPSTLWLLSVLGLPVRVIRLGFRNALCARDWVFLWGWFLLSFLPFLKLYTEHVHLMYALLPGSILAALLARDLLDGIRARARWLKPAFAAVVVLTVCDQCTNVLATHLATVRIISGYRAVADAIARETQPGDPVVANFPGAEEIRYHGNARNTVYFTVGVGVPHPSRVVDDPAKLQRLLDTARPGKDVYFLAVEFDYLPKKAFFHPHKYVRFNTVETSFVGVVHETRASVPFLDPVKQWIPRELMPFPASPDLMNDFYFGPDRDGRPFRREVHARYHLYRVTGRKVDPWLPSHQLRIVESGLRDYNILECNGRYFAIHQSEGDFDVGRACRGEYQYCGIRNSLGGIRSWIAAQRDLPARSPQLVADHRGYNIIRFGIRYYGIQQGDGGFDLDRIRQGQYRNAVEGPDLSILKRRIDSKVDSGLAASPVPLLVESNYRGYNIIVSDGRFYGILQADGAFDPQRFRDGRYRDAVVADDLSTVKRRIRSIVQSAVRERTRL